MNLRRSALGLTNVETLAAQAALADFLVLGARKFEEGEALSHETWMARQKLLGPEHPDTLDSMTAYLTAMAMPGQNGARVEPLAREIISLRERVNGSNDFLTIDAVGNLAAVLATQAKFAEAERYARDELARFQRAGFADRANALNSVNNLAFYRMMQGDAAEAEKLLLDVIPRATRTLGQEHPETLHFQHNLARIYAEQGRLDEAEALARETLAKRRRVTPAHEGIGRTLLILGRVLVEKEKPDEAEPLLKESLAFFRDNYSMKANIIAQLENSLGAVQLAHSNYVEAEALLVHGSEEFFKPSIELAPRESKTALGHIVQLYKSWGKPERAADWQKRIDARAKVDSTVKTQ
jgi:tetratricopeptide (TPR) repeat protein